jgi:hypothetical protein
MVCVLHRKDDFMGEFNQKEIKNINSSLNQLPKKTERELGVQAVQYNDNVFYSGNNSYKKIYIFRPSILGNKRGELVKALCHTFNNRIRLTSYLKNKDGKLSSYMFLTVYFEYASYYEAMTAINEFEIQLSRYIASILNIQIAACDLETVLTYVHMTSTGEMREMDTDYLFEKNGVDKIYASVKQNGDGTFSCKNVPNRYGITYIGKNYPDEPTELTNLFTQNDGSYQYFIEFQRYSDVDRELYKKELNKRYCTDKNINNEDIYNMTYALTAITDDESNFGKINSSILEFYDDKNIQIMTGSGREADIYLSCASLGLREFHSMQNVSLNVISNLLL